MQGRFHRRKTIRDRQALLLLVFATLVGVRAAYYQILDPPGSLPVHLEQARKEVGQQKASPGERSLQARSPKKTLPAGPLDLNRATREELMTLPGIGPVLADRILAYRRQNGPFTDISEIKQVDGIGDKRFDRIRPWIETRRR